LQEKQEFMQKKLARRQRFIARKAARKLKFRNCIAKRKERLLRFKSLTKIQKKD